MGANASPVVAVDEPFVAARAFRTPWICDLPQEGCDAASGVATSAEKKRSVVDEMKLRAQITIDLQVQDYIEAAEHQRRISAIAEKVQADYAQAALDFRQRRDRPSSASRPAVQGAIHYTGRMRDYE